MTPKKPSRSSAPFLLALSMLSADAYAGPLLIPSDISTAVTAAPQTDLQPGQMVTFTVSITNHGPAPVSSLLVTGPQVYDQLFFPAGSWNDSGMFVNVVDLVDTSHWNTIWYPAAPIAPAIAVGETRTCHLQLALTSAAPAIMPVSFGLPQFIVDQNPANDRATVLLAKPVRPVPGPSPGVLALLTFLLLGSGLTKLRKVSTRMR